MADLRTMVDQGLTIHASDAATPMKRPFNEGADGPVGVAARDFSQGRRKKLAKTKKAMPDGSFPIVNDEDLENAKRAIGRAKNPAKARAWINKRAKQMGKPGVGQEMDAGGPGSGCKGPNCGRHGGGKGTDKTHVPKKATVDRFADPSHERIHRQLGKAETTLRRLGLSKHADKLSDIRTQLADGGKISYSHRNVVSAIGGDLQKRGNANYSWAGNTNDTVKQEKYDKLGDKHLGLADRLFTVSNNMGEAARRNEL